MFSFCSIKSLSRKTAKSGDKLSEDAVKAHLLRQTFQRMSAAILEAQAGAGHQVADRTRHDRFSRFRLGRDACCDVPGDAGDVVALPFDLAGVETAAHR